MRIFTDSACDLPLSFYEQNDVTIIPLRVHIDDKEYYDMTTISPFEVFQAIQEGKQPKTSQASPEQFYEHFEALAKAGESGIYIALSSELSGTHNTSVMIREQLKETYPDLNLVIIDSKLASLGYGLLVKLAVQLKAQGDSLEQIEQKIRYAAERVESLFTVDDLGYMARGGRISKSSAVVGGLLNIKPLLEVDNGKLVPIEKHRGRKKILKRMIELMEERGSNWSNQVVGISHAADEEFANELRDIIEEKFKPKSIEIEMIGAVIGAHTGLGTLALFFSKE